MKTIKIIDLLNKIANGEEIPQKIIYKDNEYKWERNTDYRKGDIFLFTEECINETFLNEKVEIIEEEKEIEPLVYDEDCTNEWCIKELYEKVYELTEAVNGIRKEK